MPLWLITQVVMVVLWFTVLPAMAAWVAFLPTIIYFSFILLWFAYVGGILALVARAGR